MHTISIAVTGKVQGVYYRQSTKEMAISLGVVGQVRNLKDGSVYIIATGVKEQLDKLISWCRVGPSKANITGLVVEELPLQLFENFSIERF